MKSYLTIISLALASTAISQNIGINQNSPTNSLHVSPINIGDNPIRIDNMQSYTSGDTTLLIIDQPTGIVRYVSKSDLGGMLGDVLFQNSTFLDSLTTHITNGSGTGGAGDQTLGSTGTDITLTNGGSVSFSTINANDWHTNGNTGTNSSTNFLGTTDNQGLSFKTNNIERMNIFADGRVVVNSTTAFASSIFHSVSTGTDDAITVDASGTGTGIHSQNSGSGPAIVGINSGTNSGILGTTADASSAGIQATNTSPVGNGIISSGNNLPGYYFATGAGGSFSGETGSYSRASIATGTGVVGLGNNQTLAHLLTSGSGGAFTGNDGILASATVTAGTGVVGAGNNSTQYFMQTSGGGGSFTGTQNGAYGFATNTSGNSRGLIGEGSEYGVVSIGDFGGTGAKYFIIDHPLDPENKILKHACIESPEILNIYRGNIILNAQGEGIVQLPDYFHAINTNFSYTLTPIGAPTVTYIAEEINENGTFKIAGGNANQKISWYVYAERNDKSINNNPKTKQMVVEKTGEQIGKYLNPAAYGKDRSYSYFGSKGYTTVKTEGKEVKSNVGLKK